MNLSNFADKTYETNAILGKKRKVPEIEINKLNNLRKTNEKQLRQEIERENGGEGTKRGEEAWKAYQDGLKAEDRRVQGELGQVVMQP